MPTEFHQPRMGCTSGSNASLPLEFQFLPAPSRYRYGLHVSSTLRKGENERDFAEKRLEKDRVRERDSACTGKGGPGASRRKVVEWRVALRVVVDGRSEPPYPGNLLEKMLCKRGARACQ